MGVEGDGFAEFIAAREVALQRTAWWLTGDWALAEDLVQAALVRSWPKWERVSGLEEPELYVRRMMVNLWASWSRRRWRTEQVTDSLPDSHAPGDLAAEVTARLAVRDALGRRMEAKLRELMQTLGDPPCHVTAPAVRHQVVRRHRRFTIIAAVAAAAVLAAVIPALASVYGGLAHSGEGSPAGSCLTPLPDGKGSVYHDAAGWMIDVPPGWHVLSFRSSKDGATAAGAQISNVLLPVPALMPGFPVQASGETLPARGVALVIVADTDPKVCRPGPHPSPAGGSNYCQRSWASPPVSFKDMNLGSSLGGAPVTSFLWVKAGGTALSLTAKFGASAFSDRWVTPVSTMLASLRATA